MAGTIDTIIFDLGGVVINQPEDLWSSIFAQMAYIYGINPAIFYGYLKKEERDIHEGKITLLGFYKAAVQESKSIMPETLLRTHIELYEKHAGTYNKEILELINMLKKKYKVVCLTNIERETAELNRKKGLFSYFDDVFLSYEIRQVKPDPGCYETVLRKLQKSPEMVLFIDDNPEYVQGAENAGINSVLYENAALLKSKLSSLGIIT